MVSTATVRLQRKVSVSSYADCVARLALPRKQRGLHGGTDMREQADGAEERALVQRCCAGDAAAMREFQERYGEVIYAYPIRAYRVPADEAGDFYVFALEGGRLFRRLRTFAGRVPLRSYLVGFVLDHLMLEWKRQAREVDTISLDAMEQERPAELPTADTSGPPESSGGKSWQDILAELPLQKALVLKLLHVEDADFSPVDLRYLAKASGKSIADVIDAIEQLRATVREREATVRRLDDQLESVHGWVRLYQRRLARLQADGAHRAPESEAASKLDAERRELERKLAWRMDQRRRLWRQLQRRKVTAPYKEIARLLGTTVGNVASQILRVRREVARQLGGVTPLRRDPQREV